MPSLDARGLRRAVELVLVGTPVHEHRRLTTAKHIAERLGFSERYVRGLIDAGAFEIVRFGRAVRVYEDSVDRWIRERKEKT